jgi:uncharacterized protein
MTQMTGGAPGTAVRGRIDSPRALVVINGDDVYEDLFSASLKLQEILSTAGFAARAAMGTQRLANAVRYDLVVLYSAMGSFPCRVQAALASAIAAGTGLLAVHSASVFPSAADGTVAADHRLAASLIGGRYRSHGPAPHQSRFRVLTDEQHPVTRCVTSFDITHEHYQLELDPGAQVIAWREVTADDWPAREPVCFVRFEGCGRVCYVQLGHDMRVWDEPGVRNLITRAAIWTCRQLPTPEAR